MPSTISAGTTAGTAIAIAGDTTGNLAFQTNGTTTAMTITTAQNVGVGTTTPSGKLHTFQSGADSTVQFEAGTAGYASNLNIIANTAPGGAFNNITSFSGGSAEWRIGGSGNNNTIVFSTGSGYTERGRFDSSGNFQFNSGYGSVATAYGCRAWVNFNGQSTPAIRTSGNVSSITDFGAGDYGINFTTAMPDVNYASVGGVQKDDGNNDANIYVQVGGYVGRSQSTSATYARVARLDGFGAIDSPAVYVAVFR